MMVAAEPSDLQGLAVIVMMLLDRPVAISPKLLAWLRGQLPAKLVDACYGPGVGPLSLSTREQPVRRAVLAAVSVAAVPAP